jgi:DNA-binding MarR family transcriptional regulator
MLDAGRRIGRAAIVFHGKVAEQFGLGPTDMKALDLLQVDGPLTPADLGEQLGFAPASVTAIVDRLENKRLVRRTPHPSDGRRLLIEFDPSAMSMLVPLYAPFFQSLSEMLGEYDTDELILVTRAFDDIAERQMAAARSIGSQ